MTELQKVYFEQEFTNIEDLYKFLSKNSQIISEKFGIKIARKSVENKIYCLITKELITERNILIFATQDEITSAIGELIVLAGAFNAVILVFIISERVKYCACTKISERTHNNGEAVIVNKITPAILEPIKWLKNAFHKDMELILAEAKITKQ